jgi:hypothetical protein
MLGSDLGDATEGAGSGVIEQHVGFAEALAN